MEEEALQEILTAGLYAPSAGNNQYSRIVVCQDPDVNLKLGKLSRYMQFKGQDPAKTARSISADQPSIQDDFTILDGFYGAPTVLTIFTRPGQYAHDDAAMIAENIMLAAHFLGVGSVRHGVRYGKAPGVGRSRGYGAGVQRAVGLPGRPGTPRQTPQRGAYSSSREVSKV